MRSGWRVQKEVIRALFLREAVHRLSAGRAAWLWILLEPIAHVVFLMMLFGFVMHQNAYGIDGAMFIMTGLLGYFMTRNTATHSIDAIKANKALFAYRQVMPVDTVVVRALLEGFLLLISAIVLLAGAGLAGLDPVPADPLTVFAAATGLWLCGAGLGLLLSVASVMVPEVAKIAALMFTPLYFMSGVMVPAMAVPQPYRGWLMLNPLLHGVETLRGGFFAHFHPAPNASLFYLYTFALVTVFFGLALHIRFSQRLVAQ